jgi:hypothetical protein
MVYLTSFWAFWLLICPKKIQVLRMYCMSSRQIHIKYQLPYNNYVHLYSPAKPFFLNKCIFFKLCIIYSSISRKEIQAKSHARCFQSLWFNRIRIQRANRSFDFWLVSSIQDLSPSSLSRYKQILATKMWLPTFNLSVPI